MSKIYDDFEETYDDFEETKELDFIQEHPKVPGFWVPQEVYDSLKDRAYKYDRLKEGLTEFYNELTQTLDNWENRVDITKTTLEIKQTYQSAYRYCIELFKKYIGDKNV